MKSNKWYLSIGVLLMSTFTSLAQPRSITLKEAIDLSLQNSKQLKLGNARIAEATAELREAKERRLPDLKVSGSYMRLNSPNVDLKLKLGSQQQSGEGSGEANTSSAVKVDQAMYGMANLSLPLFSGLRIQYGIESSRYLAEATRLDAEKDKEEIIQNTINAYSNLYKAKAAVELMKESLRSSQERSKELSNLEKNGLLARNDLLKAELQTSNVELTLLDAESNYKVAAINMNLMLGLDEQTELVADDNSFTNVTDIKSAADWESIALQNRKDIAALGLREKAATSAVKAAKGEYYPSLALTGGYVALHVPNFITVTNALNAGIGVQYNIGSLWKTGAKVQQARARVQQMQANEAILADAIKLQVNQAYQNYLLGQKKISVYHKAIEQATENYRIVRNKYENSLATTTELLDADIAQLQAKLNYSNAKADAAVSYDKLLQVSGILTQK